MLILECPLLLLFALVGHAMATTPYHDISKVIAKALSQSDLELLAQKTQDEQLYRAGVDAPLFGNQNSMHMLGSFGGLKRPDSEQAERGTLLTRATQILVQTFRTDVMSLRQNPVIMGIWSSLITPYCQPKVIKCFPSPYRTVDGSCNNLNNPTWGMTDRAQKRLLPAMYSDGVSAPRMYSVTGVPLPSPRTVSNAIHRAPMTNVFEETSSVMLMMWGQLMDHDFINTPMLKGFHGSEVTCCDLPKHITRTACFPIQIPFKDPFFRKTCMNFVRSASASAGDCGPCFREQMNQASSYIDAGFLYGTDMESMKALRSFSHGMLKMTKQGFYFPAEDQTQCVPGDRYCMKSGDHRIHVFPGLSSLQILFMRDHNKVAGMLAKINPHWNDERIYQETRKICIAIVQKIHYNEFAEKVIGPGMMAFLGLYVKPKGYNNVYNPMVDATVSNAFGAAAFRFGHSLVPGHVNMFFRNNSQQSFPIEQHFNRPNLMFADGGKGSDHVNRWLIHAPAARGDRFVEPGIQDKLFLDDEGDSFDLISLNIQRGRDHGIPGYNSYRRLCNLPFATTFFNMPDIDPYAAKSFAQTYKHPEDIDLFSGGLAETNVPGGAVGPTFACIIGRQFRDAKFGDRFYFENQEAGFTPSQLASIKNIRLATVMCGGSQDRLAPLDAFSIPSTKNPHIPCASLPMLQIWFWQETPTAVKDIIAVRPPYNFMAKLNMF